MLHCGIFLVLAPNSPADKYLQHVGFKRYDFFIIIISADRFKENDVKLAQEIQRMGKRFYFVRSKIDCIMRDEEETQSQFNEEKTFIKIRENCIQGLEKQGVDSPKVFLVSSHHYHLYDFCLLQETLERELPAHKRDTLLLALPIVNLEITTKKKEAFQAKVKYIAFSSALTAAVPVPGLSCAVDITMLVTTAINHCRVLLIVHVYLGAEMKSPLALKEISNEVILNLLHVSWFHVASMAAEEGVRLAPLTASAAAAALSLPPPTLLSVLSSTCSLRMLTGYSRRPWAYTHQCDIVKGLAWH
ncbi:hypothetical protein F7725_006315, partial [Dissostichus mawsoni]